MPFDYYVVARSKVDGSGLSIPTPDQFTINSVTYAWNPRNLSELLLFVNVTPPDPIGPVEGGHVYLELPDQSGDGEAFTLDDSPLDGTSPLTGGWTAETLMDMGQQPYVAAQRWRIAVPNADQVITGPTDIRVRVVAYSKNEDPAPTQDTPSAVVTVSPYVPPKDGSGVEYGPAVTGITATALAEDNSTGKLRSPIKVEVDLSGLPNPLPADFAYELVAVWPGEDYHDETQVHVLTGPQRISGLVPSSADGITTPHTFVVETPRASTVISIFARTVRIVDGAVVAKNKIIAGITPVATVTIGGAPTLDVSALNNIGPGITNEGGILQVHNGDGIALDFDGKLTVNAGVGLTIDGSGFLVVNPGTGLSTSGGQIHIPGGAITNSLLAALAVAQANIQNGAVGTAQYIAASVTTAIIANAAITNALLGTAVVGTANIQNAAITNALIANLAVGTANIQDLAVTDAKINSLSVSKLTAGTITATISINAPTITGGSISGATLTLTSNGITTTISNANVAGQAAGLSVLKSSNNDQTVIYPGVISTYNAGVLQAVLTWTGQSGNLILYNNAMGASSCLLSPDGLALSNFGAILDGQAKTLSFNGGVQVLTVRQTGPGNTTDSTDVATRFNSLLGALRTHGLIT